MDYRTILGWAMAAGGALERANEDVAAFLRNDPAARDRWDVLLFAPGLHALWMHRVAHAQWAAGHSRFARLLAYANRFLTGIDIHPAAVFGRRVVIDHGMGVVVGETASIGDDCVIYKGVVLGARTFERAKRHPDLEAGVVVGSNACVLGDIRIGARTRIGSGSVVLDPVPPASTVAGVPARIVSSRADGTSKPVVRRVPAQTADTVSLSETLQKAG